MARVAKPDATLPAAAIRILIQERVSADVVVDGRRIGSVTLESAGEPLLRGLLGLLVFDLLGAIFVVALVLVVERRLTGHITRPLTDLEAVIRTAREKRDFSRRALPCGIAEIEALRTDFHGLLDEIQRRDEDLGRTHAALKRLAFRDTLTGLANRAMLESALLTALGGDAQDDERTGIVYFDIDSFKAVNDALGHATGDALLKGLASRLQRALPPHAHAGAHRRRRVRRTGLAGRLGRRAARPRGEARSGAARPDAHRSARFPPGPEHRLRPVRRSAHGRGRS